MHFQIVMSGNFCTLAMCFLDAIASPSTYPCQSVGGSLIVSDFGDIHCIYRACELVCLQCYISSLTKLTIRPFLRPVDAVKEGIFPDYYQVSIYWGIYTTSIHHSLAQIWRNNTVVKVVQKMSRCAEKVLFRGSKKSDALLSVAQLPPIWKQKHTYCIFWQRGISEQTYV